MLNLGFSNKSFSSSYLVIYQHRNFSALMYKLVFYAKP